MKEMFLRKVVGWIVGGDLMDFVSHEVYCTLNITRDTHNT